MSSHGLAKSSLHMAHRSNRPVWPLVDGNGGGVVGETRADSDKNKKYNSIEILVTLRGRLGAAKLTRYNCTAILAPTGETEFTVGALVVDQIG